MQDVTNKGCILFLGLFTVNLFTAPRRCRPEKYWIPKMVTGDGHVIVPE